MLDFTQTIQLKRAWDYSAPRRPSRCLPLVYGDMTQGGAGGLWEAVCLDVDSFVYALAGHQLTSLAAGNAVTLYDREGQVIDPADYALNLTHDFQGQGIIATATFAADARQREPITARAQGRPGEDGALLANPVDLAAHFVRGLAGASGEELDTTSLNRARARAVALGYAAAGVVSGDLSLGDLLTSLLSNFLGSWWLGGGGRLKLFLDLGAGSLDEGDLLVSLREGDLAQVAVSARLEEMANLAEARYCHNFARAEYEAAHDGLASRDLRAQGLHGLAKRSLELSWVRSEAVAATICARLVALLGRPRRVITCRESSLANLPLEKGDTALISLSWLQDPQGRPLKNQIVRVLGLELDLDAGAMSYTLLDTGFYKTLAFRADGAHAAGGQRQAGGERDLGSY
ncbi:MAG: hypothetical protein K9K66_14165 [Desulfarculaceae bacterium]|nr:hypothetical protein [Desulfarculaceae bacterium]MCF8073817.1 hypothetical protein [Desulfarculaceae bacterium]MCF8102797.1 hypothetical protein [Desulfarculaceae bacterium]MCF8116241.1 hypothetical protein [Desulfarculaceae bacterium]